MKIITTVGTSIFSNCKNTGEDIDTLYKQLEKTDYSKWGETTTKTNVEKLRKKINTWAESEGETACAEIASIIEIQAELLKTKGVMKVQLHFICTETILSHLAAECIVKWFEDKDQFEIKTTVIIHGLQVKQKERFEKEGLVNLLDEIEKISEGYWLGSCINITGGYKAIIPFLTIVAQIYKVPIYYIFEESDNDRYELLKMPQTPIDVNWSEFEKYSNVWEDLREGIDNWSEYQYKQQISDDYHACIWLDEKSDYALISGIGEAFLRRYKKWTFIYVLQNGSFTQNYNWRKSLNDAISNLQSKLNQFIQANNLQNKTREEVVNSLRSNGGELDHTDLMKGTIGCISKYPSSKPEIRILYSFDLDNGKVVKLKIWDFRIGEFNHSTYPKEFREFYEANQNGKFIPYLQVENS